MASDHDVDRRRLGGEGGEEDELRGRLLSFLLYCCDCRAVTARYSSQRTVPSLVMFGGQRVCPACSGADVELVRGDDPVAGSQFLRQCLRGLVEVDAVISSRVISFDGQGLASFEGALGDDIDYHNPMRERFLSQFDAPPLFHDDEEIVQHLLQATANQDYGRPPASGQAVARLPRVAYTTHLRKHFRARHLDEFCPVCRDDFDEVSALVRLPCGHFICNVCVERWLAQDNSCPVCRHELNRLKRAQDERRVWSERMGSQTSTSWREFLTKTNLRPFVVLERSFLLGHARGSPVDLPQLLEPEGGARVRCPHRRLLMSVSFLRPVSVHALVIRAEFGDGQTAAVDIDLYANRPELDWDDVDARDPVPTQSFQEMHRESFEVGAEPLYLRCARFRGVTALAVALRLPGLDDDDDDEDKGRRRRGCDELCVSSMLVYGDCGLTGSASLDNSIDD